ncbi:MAG: ATP-binding cassette domain-containing protein [Spirochaetaceae bacterium]|nr:ATP-binding cassette domain-containing protein [Spirochaetaceae bacterium]
MVELRKIYKTFLSNGARALEGADFDLRRGEIHAVFGENGAGKSTLMQILAGFERPDSGEIIIDDKKRRFSSPADALSIGISMVRQRPELCPGLRVWEACVLGAEARRGPFFCKHSSRDMVSRLSREWGFDLPVDALSETLTAAERQKAAVLAALLRKTRLIIFDEPTAVLNQIESQNFFALVGRLAAAGHTLVIISHKLDETLALAHRATVMRKGIRAAVLDKSEFDAQKIIALMFGQDYETDGGGDSALYAAHIEADKRVKAEAVPLTRPLMQSTMQPLMRPLMRAENLTVTQAGCPAIHSINMELYGGTIYGLAGVRESGTETLMLALSGFLKLEAGRVFINGCPVFGGDLNSVLCFRGSGGVYLGMDGGQTACDKRLSIYENLIIHAHRRFPHPLFGKIGILDGRRLREWAFSLTQKAGIAGQLSAKAGGLSGGMLQRLLETRELAENAKLILMSEPGWGLDVRRRRALYGLLRKEAEAGKAVLLFLSDLNDLLEVSGEIFVMSGGSIALRLTSKDLSAINGGLFDESNGVPNNGAASNGGLKNGAAKNIEAFRKIKNRINAAMSGAGDSGFGKIQDFT